MKISIKIHLQNGCIKTLANYKKLTTDPIVVKEITQNSSEVFVLEQKNALFQTQYVLNGVNSCWLLVFDNECKFVTAKPYFAKNTAPFSFFIPEPFIVLLPIGAYFQFRDIKSIEINQPYFKNKK